MEHWFLEQLNERKKMDEAMLQSALSELEYSADSQDFALFSGFAKEKSNQAALLKIFNYYKIEAGTLEDFTKKGVLYRLVELKNDWFTDSADPLLGINEDGSFVALIPNNFGTYYYVDENNKRHTINKHHPLQFSKAVSFCRRLPEREITARDICSYLFSELSIVQILTFLLFTVLNILLGIALPALTDLLFQRIQDSFALPKVGIVFIALVWILFVSTLFVRLNGLLFRGILHKACFNLFYAVADRMLHMPISLWKAQSSGDVWKKMDSIIVFAETVLNSTFLLLVSGSLLLAYLIQICLFGNGMFLPLLAIVFLQIGLTILLSYQKKKFSGLKNQMAGQEAEHLSSILSGMGKIKSIHSENRIFVSWAKIYGRILRAAKQEETYQVLNETVLRIFPVIIMGVIYIQVFTGRFSLSSFVALSTAVLLAEAQISIISPNLLALITAYSNWEIAKPLLSFQPMNSTRLPLVNRLGSNIVVENVSFQYAESSQPVFENLNLHVKANEFLGIVGSSGCGKTTLIRLLSGLEHPQQGNIYYGSTNISTINPKSVFLHLRSMPGSDCLLPGTLYDNLFLGNSSITTEELWDVLRKVDLDKDIAALPLGLKTPVGTASGFSGGQVQRILIARALLNHPKILLMDESTSALDNVMQNKIKHTVQEIKCTKIIVAHRLSTIKDCDRIIVLDHGNIVESGTYDELLKKHKFFAELVERQRIEKADCIL